jgi:hypothetical protein
MRPLTELNKVIASQGRIKRVDRLKDGMELFKPSPIS